MKMSIRTPWRPVKQILVVTRLITREAQVKSEKRSKRKYLQPEVFCQC